MSAEPPPNSAAGNVASKASAATFWKRVQWSLRTALAVGVALAVFLFTVGFRDTAAPVLPDTTAQFSLDLEVTGSTDLDIVYLVEQRARPSYRIFAFDPQSGTDTTIFTVPDSAIIFGMTLSPDRSTLAVSYSPDFQLQGSGIWTLDLDSLELAPVIEAEADIYLTEPEYSADGQTIFVTHVDRTGDDEVLSVGAVSLEHGTVDIVIEDAITPAVSDNDLYYLAVDDQKARRSIGLLAADGSSAVVPLGDGDLDLDHLIAARTTNDLHVAVLEQSEESIVSLGEPADAHGNHNVKSAWWTVDSFEGEANETDVEPIIVHDAAHVRDTSTIVYATLEGLSIADGERQDLIRSRALRFVAA